MAIKIQSTKTSKMDQGIKILLYGASGAGKTRISSTLPGNTIILSAEAGLLSLQEFDIDVITINTFDELKEAYKYLNGKEGEQYDNIVLDSLSEIAEIVLENAKNSVKDGRMAYGEMAERIVSIVKAFRDMANKNIVMIAKLERTKDELSGALLYTPSFPGAKLAQNLPYLFDEVFALRVDKQDDETIRFIQTSTDNQWSAKDRSGKLSQFEEANLTSIINKIGE